MAIAQERPRFIRRLGSVIFAWILYLSILAPPAPGIVITHGSTDEAHLTSSDEHSSLVPLKETALPKSAAQGQQSDRSGQKAQVATLRPGDGQIDGRRIPAYTNAWQSYRVTADGERRALAVWCDTVTVVQQDGREVLRRVQKIITQGAPTTVLVNEADRVSLLPLRTTARIGDGEPFIDVRFDGSRVSGRRLLLPHNGGPADLVSAEMALDLGEPLYDWRWWGLLAAAQPIEANYVSRFMAIATEPTIESPLVWVTVRVVGEEQVGNVPCWVVEVEAGAPWTLWIAKSREKPPIQRVSIEQPDGSALLWEQTDLCPADSE